jgi:hypothetical protein
MAGLVRATHVYLAANKTWVPGTSPGMTRSATADTVFETKSLKEEKCAA